ncbi:hypothetical protein [Sulfuricystis multivorans]|uniref:hypothetical protein n=1 Tax=Sulfuricystis multivorans TaxID=2211108 RepID=UPI000F849C34|nr:hypothetical protein [Sulfuricystis multivorans]
MAPSLRLIGAILLAATALDAGAQSAWEQAKELAGPNYRPPDLPTPRMECVTCTNRSAPAPKSATNRASAPRTKSVAPSLPLGATMGAAIFGSLLQQAFSFEDAGPDPAELARQEEARRRAEAEAQRRAAEEESRHRALLASLKSVPLSAATSAHAASGGLELKALSSLDAPPVAPQSGEALRAAGGAGWDSPRLRFAVRHRPLVASDALPVLAPQTVCDASGCRWPAAGKPVVVKVTSGAPRIHHPDAKVIVDLIAAGQKMQRNLRDLVIARLLESPPQEDARPIAQIRRLWDKSRRTLLAIAWAWGGLFIDELVPGGKGIMLIKDVYELADQSLSDAAKAAGWLGSVELDAPPEITSVEEAAQPFLYRGITENKTLAEGVKNAFTVVTEANDLAKKLMGIWEIR